MQTVEKHVHDEKWQENAVFITDELKSALRWLVENGQSDSFAAQKLRVAIKLLWSTSVVSHAEAKKYESELDREPSLAELAAIEKEADLYGIYYTAEEVMADFGKMTNK